ncbi:MAG: hypothetical protein GY792_01035 [Gammaproteobacteria bacterium]|nr:hypothetical protein [Gammaproteobacteria bacterium]
MLPTRAGRHNNQVGSVILSLAADDLKTVTIEWVIGVFYRDGFLRTVGIMRLFLAGGCRVTGVSTATNYVWLKHQVEQKMQVPIHMRKSVRSAKYCCPECGMHNSETDLNCRHCGVIFTENMRSQMKASYDTNKNSNITTLFVITIIIIEFIFLLGISLT